MIDFVVFVSDKYINIERGIIGCIIGIIKYFNIDLIKIIKILDLKWNKKYLLFISMELSDILKLNKILVFVFYF